MNLAERLKAGKLTMFDKWRKTRMEAEGRQWGVGSGNAQGFGKDHHSFKHGLKSIAPRSLGKKCERCGSTRFLLVHHKDRNRRNNDLRNLETLCKRCHQIEHDCQANWPKGEELSQRKKVQAARANRDEFGRFCP